MPIPTLNDATKISTNNIITIWTLRIEKIPSAKAEKLIKACGKIRFGILPKYLRVNIEDILPNKAKTPRAKDPYLAVRSASLPCSPFVNISLEKNTIPFIPVSC